MAARARGSKGHEPQRASVIDEQALALIRAGICPWCERRDLRRPAMHINVTHGIGRRELRERLGVTAVTTVTTPEDTAQRRELNSRPERVAQIRQLAAPSGKHRPTAAGRAVMQQSARAIPSRPGRPSPIGQDQRERIRNARARGETYRAIASQEGLGESTVHRIVNGRRDRALALAAGVAQGC